MSDDEKREKRAHDSVWLAMRCESVVREAAVIGVHVFTEDSFVRFARWAFEQAASERDARRASELGRITSGLPTVADAYRWFDVAVASGLSNVTITGDDPKLETKP